MENSKGLLVRSHLITLVRTRGHFRRYGQTDLLHRLAIDVELDFFGCSAGVSGFGSFQELIYVVAALTGDLGAPRGLAPCAGVAIVRALLKSVMRLAGC